jgi:hypothetical protein
VASPFLDRSAAPLRIGSNGTNAGHFSGTIDEVRVYDTVRSPEQIADHMNAARSLARPAEEGLVAAYGFEANRGDRARDDTGNGHDSIVSRATWVRDGRFGGAMRFDGTSELLVPAANDLDSGSALTLEAWVRASRVLPPEATIIGRSDDAYYLRASSSFGPFRPTAGGRFGSVPRFAYAPDAFRPDEWTHLAMTFDTRAIRVYVNGDLSATRIHWSPHRPVHARLNGAELPWGPVPDPGTLRQALTHAVALDVTLICGHRDRALAPMFLISGLQSSETLAVTASGDDLFVKPLARGAGIGLPTPVTRVPGAMKACAAGETLPLRITGHLQNPEVRRGTESLGAVPPGLGAAWSFLIHADLLPGWTDMTITGVWLATLAMPLGLWARWSVASVASVGVLVAALAYLPVAFHVRGLYGREVAFLVIGGTLGLVVRAANRPVIPPNDFGHCESA